MKPKFFSFLVILALCFYARSQGVGINETGASPDPSAMLDINSTEKGLLGPRMTTAQRNNIPSPAQGLQIFNLDTDCIEVFFANGGWKPVECGCTTFPDASFNNPVGFANIPFNLSANTINVTSSYNWSIGSGSPATSNNPTENVTWTTAGTYPVTLTVTDINNCSASSTENIEIIPCASFPDATFTGSNGSINSPIAFSANGSGPGYTYAWTFPSGTPSTSTAQNPSVEWATAGTYTVELTVTDNLGCPSTETLEVTISLCTPDGPWNFTNCGQIGRFGPSQAQCNSFYSSTNLSGQVTVTGGIQEWTVPSSGTYRINAMGAGANARQGGSGAEIQGDFSLTAGEVIRILVGQRPEPFNTSNGGAAGGSFVAQSPYNTNASILVVAGGGGGGHNNGIQPNSHGRAGNEGGAGTSLGGAGGINGNAGQSSNSQPGSGFFQNGTTGTSSTGAFPLSFVNGGTGGTNGSNQAGFGGGGAQGNSHGGGGGGYSGGGGTGSNPWHGGGGGSYNNGSNPINSSGVRNGHGAVTIEKICP